MSLDLGPFLRQEICPRCATRGAGVVLFHVPSSTRQTEQCHVRCSACFHEFDWEVSHLAMRSVGLLPERAKLEAKPAEPEKVIQGSVIGYRAWRIMNWALHGTGVNRAWSPGVNEATCDDGNQDAMFGGSLRWSLAGAPADWGKHPAPAAGCHCGITALARFKKEDAHWSNADVFGAIEAWSDETMLEAKPGDVADATGVEVGHRQHGRFILHPTGFRAQYGKVVLLAVDDDWPAAKKAAVRALATKHEADVCAHAHLEDAAKEHGQLVPDELLGWAGEVDPEPPLPASGAFQRALSQQFAMNTVQIRNAFGGNYWSYPAFSGPKIEKGICETLKGSGPPWRRKKYSHGDRVKDSNGKTWRCVKAGKPGTWEAE